MGAFQIVVSGSASLFWAADLGTVCSTRKSAFCNGVLSRALQLWFVFSRDIRFYHVIIYTDKSPVLLG